MKTNSTVTKNYNLTESLKQDLIDYISGGTIKITQEKVLNTSYLTIYTTTAPNYGPITVLKNNQLTEPFNIYYQTLLKSPDTTTDIDIIFYQKKLEELHLSENIMKYLKTKFPQIKTVRDFIRTNHYIRDSYMDYIKNILLTFEALTQLVIKQKKLLENKEELDTNSPKLNKNSEINLGINEFKKEEIPKLEIEEKDYQITEEFLTASLTKEEFDTLYWQVWLIHQSIDFSTLRKYAYLKLASSTNQKYPNLWMDLTDEKDGIYKQVKISIEDMTTSIEQCKNLNNGYFISERIEVWNTDEIYFYQTLLKTNFPKKKEFIELAQKAWLYNNEIPLEKIKAENYTKINSTNKQVSEPYQKERKKQYIKCLSKNKI